MILRSGRRGREFDSPCTPLLSYHIRNSILVQWYHLLSSKWLVRVRFPNVTKASVAQLAARGSHNPKVVGSTPTGGRFSKLLVRKSALVAQLAALRSYEPMVQGSSPCRSIVLMISILPKVLRPGIEPGTYCVLGSRHNQLDHRSRQHPRRDSNPQSRDS